MEKNFFNRLKTNKKNLIFFIGIVIVCLLLIILSVMASIPGNQLNLLLKGSDFNHFYNYAQSIRDGKAGDLYDYDFYRDFFSSKNNSSANINFKPYYSPFLYYFYLPLSFLPPFWGVLVCSVFFITLYIASILLLINTLRRLIQYQYMIIFFSLFFPPFIYSLLICHPTILLIFLISLAFYLSKNDLPFQAGLALSFFLMRPDFYFIVFLILLFSFRPKLFSGLFTGSLMIIFLTGIWDLFHLWTQWIRIIISYWLNFLDLTSMVLIKQSSIRTYFYSMTSNNPVSIQIEYIFILTGLLGILVPIIYSFFHKKNFSRNSFWFMFAISSVLANPFLYNFDLIILVLPLIIFFNLMLADRVSHKVIIVILVLFCIFLAAFYLLSKFIYVQLLAVIFWFFLINVMIKKRVRNYTPKKFVGYWENY